MKQYIVYVLDGSGSMWNIVDETISGFNSWLEAAKAEISPDRDDKFYLTVFNTEFEQRHEDMPLADVPLLDRKSYIPNGYTALLDAVGVTVAAVDKLVTDEDRVLFIVHTDGQENSSKEYSSEQVQQLIKERDEERDNWTFVFCGIGPEAWDSHQSIGINVNIGQFDQQDVPVAMAAMAVSTQDYLRSDEKKSRSFYKKS